jgi:hypothetical protein
MNSKDNLSVNPHCLTDGATEIYSPVKPLIMETIGDGKRSVGLTVVYKKPILPQFFHDLSNSLKTRFK